MIKNAWIVNVISAVGRPRVSAKHTINSVLSHERTTCHLYLSVFYSNVYILWATRIINLGLKYMPVIDYLNQYNLIIPLD